jgi:hypothetical protein
MENGTTAGIRLLTGFDYWTQDAYFSPAITYDLQSTTRRARVYSEDGVRMSTCKSSELIRRV